MCFFQDKFQEVVAKMIRGKDSIKEFEKFLKGQSDNDSGLAKFMSKTTFIDKDLGAMIEPIGAFREHLRLIGSSYQTNSTTMEKNLQKELVDVRKNFSKLIKTSIKFEAKIRKDFQSAVSAMQQAKDKEVTDKKKFEQLQVKLLKSTDLPPKELQKVSVREKNCHFSNLLASKFCARC